MTALTEASFAAPIARRLRTHDPERVLLRSAARAAIVIPSVFAFTDNVIAKPQTTIFSAFGSFSMLVLASFSGRPRNRLSAYVLLATIGAALIAIGTLCSRSLAASAVVTAVIGFAILFAGLINRYFAAGGFAALLSLILSVNIPAASSAIPARLEGWGIASAVAITAVMLLWPPRARSTLRPAVARACDGMADLLQAELDGDRPLDARIEAMNAAVASLRQQFVATPYRPTGATGATKALALLIDELDWLRSLAMQQLASQHDLCEHENRNVLEATTAVLRTSAARLNGSDARPDLERLVTARDAGVAALLRDIDQMPTGGDDGELVAALEPSFRTRALAAATWEVGANALLATGSAAPEADWGPRRRPSAPREVARLLAEHARLRSVWFQNSVRGAAALTVAVSVAQGASLQRAFWVVLGTLSVLRSNALGTGSTIVQAVAGTAVGIVVGGSVVAVIGAGHALLWAVLPIAVFLAAYAPGAISFAAGQAGFTVVLLILFNIIQPIGWKVGLVRIEDVAIGFAISLGVGVLFWPSGATASLRQRAADAYDASAAYFAAAVAAHELQDLRTTAVAAAHRLDDAYRQFLAERGHEQLDMSSVAALVAGATRLRLAGHSLATVARETGRWRDYDVLEREAAALHGWYAVLADALRRTTDPPPPEHTDDGYVTEVLRQLDRAVADGERARIQPAVGAALAADQLGNLRRFESDLAGALVRLRERSAERGGAAARVASLGRG